MAGCEILRQLVDAKHDFFVGFRVTEGTSYLHGVHNDLHNEQFLTSVLTQSSVTLGPFRTFVCPGLKPCPSPETAQMPAVEMKHLGIESDQRQTQRFRHGK